MASSKDFDLAERFGRSDVPMSEHTAVPHSPLPWQQSHRRSATDGMYRTQVYGEDGQTICTLAWKPIDLGNGVTGTYREADAKFICRAVNAHESLVKALELAAEHLAMVGLDAACSDARNALALAKGETR